MKLNIYKLKRNLVLLLGKFLEKILGIDLPAFVAAAAIVERSGKLLLINVSYNDGYALPGGGLIQGETIEEGLSREVEEETGLRITNKQYFGSYSANTGTYWVTTVFFVCKVKGSLRGSEEGKPVWIDKNKVLGRLIYEDNTAALRDYLRNK